MDHTIDECREEAMQNAIALAIESAFKLSPDTTVLETIRALNQVKLNLIEATHFASVLH